MTGGRELSAILEVWARWPEPGSSKRPEPASAQAIAEAERVLGRSLPDPLRSLYETADGGWFLGGNLAIEPLLSDKPRTGVATLTRQMHATGTLPTEAVVIGGDGSDAIFSAWVPATQSRGGTPIIESDIEGGAVALVGTDLIPFLVGRTAYYLVLYQADAAALDALAIPERFRVGEREASHRDFFFEVRAWADPLLPDPSADPYDNPTDTNAIRALSGSDR